MERSTPIRWAIIAALIIITTLLHYFTPLHQPYLHAIFQRFYYLPIILAALWFGFRGGLFCSIIVSVVYAPHILFQWGGGFALEMEKYLEILLYNIVGGVTGLLSQRERERTVELQKTARGLEESFQKLQHQSERIMVIEEQLRRAEKLSTLGEMAAVLAHEIRNPLGSIRGTAEILRDDYPPGDPKHEFIGIQIKETERLNRVVEDFLQMARPQQTAITSCSIQEELETIATLIANDARVKKVKIDLQLPRSPLLVKGEGEKLRQAFLNIAINGLQATPAGGSMVIAADQSGDRCEIRFADTGGGVEPEAMPRLFDPFFTTKSGGTGLGLAVTKRIIEGHGGTVTVESEPGEGTTVLISLPAGS